LSQKKKKKKEEEEVEEEEEDHGSWLGMFSLTNPLSACM
jgi:hypothetical protein